MSFSRLQLKPNITAEEINQLPLKAFEGKINLISDRSQVAKAFEEINRHDFVGFDTETRPVFVKGHQHKVALMQISLTHKVVLIRLNHTGVTNEIVHFLQNEKILKVGLALRDDVKALLKLRRFKPAGIFELTELTRKAGIEAEGLKKLAALVLKFRISKSAQTSNWEAEELNEKQLSYAATDAWVCHEIYRLLSPHVA